MDIFSLFSLGDKLVGGAITQTTLSKLSVNDKSHQDLIRLLSIATAMDINIFPLTWQPTLEGLGEGATGWISQSTLNAQVSLAFKRFNPTSRDAELSVSEFRNLQYDSLISEMVALSCPEIYDHPNIINLEGLCWEVHEDSEEVWPVLVFRKAACGDLRRFLTLPDAAELDDDSRIAICGEFAKALRVMHLCGIVHGDLKPENVLVNKGSEPGTYGVKVSDFGYSCFGGTYETLVKLPRSPPWEAPEWHSRWFTMNDAKKMDIYSFGLLCLWLLFPGEILNCPDSEDVNLGLAFSCQDKTAERRLKGLKEEDKLLGHAVQLISKRENLTDEVRACLQQVFKLSLPREPQERASDMQPFVGLLCDKEFLDPLDRKSDFPSASMPSWHGTLELRKFFFQVEACDYRVQNRIEAELLATAEAGGCGACSSNAAFQLALCYSFGFGVRVDSEKCQHWLQQSGKDANDLRDELDALREMKPPVSSLKQLIDLGLQSQLAEDYESQGILGQAVTEYQAMLSARTEAFGLMHFSTRRIRNFLADFLDRNGQLKESAEIRAKEIEAAEHELGPASDDVLVLKSRLAETYEDLGRLEDSEDLRYQVLKEYEDPTKKTGTARLSALYGLSSIKLTQGKDKEAIEYGLTAIEKSEKVFGPEHNRTLKAKSSLAIVYSTLGKLDNAVELNEEVAKTRERTLGLNHQDTVESLHRLGLLYNRLGKKENASCTFKRVWEAREARLGKSALSTLRAANNYASTISPLEHERAEEAASIQEYVLAELNKTEKDEAGNVENLTIAVMGDLGVTYQFQRKCDKAEHLERQVLEYRRHKYSNNHEDTLIAMRNLSDTLFNQKKWEEARDLSHEELDIRQTISDNPTEAKIAAISKLAESLARLKKWEDAVHHLDQEIAWRNEVPHTSLTAQTNAIALSATGYMKLKKWPEAKNRIAAFFETGFERAARSSAINITHELAMTCEENELLEEAEQLFLLEALVRKDDDGSSEDEVFKERIGRVVRLRARQGKKEGGSIVYDPSPLIRRAREGVKSSLPVR